MKRFIATHIPLLLSVLAAGALHHEASPPRSQALFNEVTDEVELDFSQEPGSEGDFLLPQIMGSGGAFLDYDDDGDLDIYLIQAGELPGSNRSNPLPNRLFRQEADGTFTDVTAESGLGDTGYGMGVAVGDIDNDGFVDIYVTNYGPDALYHNDGNGRFTDVTAGSPMSAEAWSASAVFCDYDRDGFLDLYVTHYVTYDPTNQCRNADGSLEYCSPQVFPGASDVLYHNNGDGTFRDVSLEAGIKGVSAPGLGVVCSDFNGDGLPDFYVANDGEANQLWQNRGNGKFVDGAILAGVALNAFGKAEAGMGVAAGDMDGDGDLDLFLTHLTHQTNTLYRNDGDLGFQDWSAPAGLGVSSLSWTGFGTGFLDYDHDGDLDIAVVNGRVQRHPTVTGARLGRYWNPYAEPNLLLRNEGNGRFSDGCTLAETFCSQVEVSRGLAVGDADNDGDLDMLLTSTAGRARLFRNDAPKNGHWLIVRAFDPALGRDAYGAVVTVVADGKAYVREADPGFSYLSSNDPRAHFGISGADTIERIVVRWPDGANEIFPGVGFDQSIVLKKGRGQKNP